MNVIHKIIFKITYAEIQHFHKLNSSYLLLPFKSMFFSLLSLHWVTINLMDEYLKAMLQLHIGNLELYDISKEKLNIRQNVTVYIFLPWRLEWGSVKTPPPGFYSVSFQSGLEYKVFSFWILLCDIFGRVIIYTDQDMNCSILLNSYNKRSNYKLPSTFLPYVWNGK